MAKTKAKRLLSLLLSLAMVMSMIVTPVYAADDDDSTSSGIEASETGETSSTSAVTYSEPEAAEAEAVAAVEDEAEAEGEELVVADEEEDLNAGIAAISEDATVATVSGTSYETLAAAISAASESNGTVTLTADVTLSEGITISSGSVTLDLNGNSITRAETYSETYLINVASGASLTVNDSGSGGKLSSTYVNSDDGYTYISNYAIITAGTVTVNAGTIRGYRAIYGSAGTVNVTGGTVYGSQIGIMESSSGSLSVNISGGSVTASHSGVYMQGGTVSVTGGTVGDSSTSYGLNLQSGSAEISGGTITAGTYGLYSAGTTTITGGTVSGYYAGVYALGTSSNVTIDGENTVVKSTATSEEDTSTTAISIWKGATVTIKNGTVTGGYCGVGIYGEYNTDDSTTRNTLNVEGGSITGVVFGIATNGSYYYTDITISGGSISGAYGMYLPAMSSTTTITGGTITGSTTGIEIRAGSLTVSGGKIVAEGDPGTYSETGNGNGATTVGAAIAVVQHTTKQAITVSVSGDAELEGYYGIFEGDLQGNGAESTKNVSITVSGGTVNGTEEAIYQATGDNITESAASIAVSGGTYSTNVSAYCADGTAAVSTSDGNYTIVKGTSGTVAIEYTASGEYNYYTSLYLASTKATSGSTITLAADIGSAEEDGEADDYFRADSSKTLTLDLNGHSIYACSGSNTSSKDCAILVTGGATLDIIDSTGNGGVVTTSGTRAVWMISGSLTIDAENYAWTGASNAVYVASQDSTYTAYSNATLLTIESGVFYGQSAVAVKNDKGDTVINGGVFVGYSSTTKATAIAGGSGTGTVTITGGYVAGNLSDQSSTFAVSGGYYISSVGSGYLAAGATCMTLSEEEQEAVSDGATNTTYLYEVGYSTFTYGYVTYDGENGETRTTVGGASSIYNVCNAISSMEVPTGTDAYIVFICLNDDYTTTGTFDTSSITGTNDGYPITLDLNGYTLTCESPSSAAITVQLNDALTIVDTSEAQTGTVKAASASPYGVVKNRGGTLLIEGGTYINTNESSDLLVNNNGGDDATSAVTTITGGYFQNGSSSAAFYQLSGTTLTIEGGYFVKDPADTTDFVATNYEVATNESADYPYYVADVIVGRNIDLSAGTITLNVYIKGAKDEDSMTVTPEATTNAATVAENTDESIDATYVLSQPVVAKKMADDWTVTVTLANGYVVEYVTSVQDYAEAVLAMNGVSDSVKNVLTAMLNYGAAVQNYASYNTSDLANANYAYDESDLSTYNATYMGNNNVTMSTTTTGDSTLALKSMGMELNHDFSIVLTYKTDLSGYTATVIDANENSLASNQVTLNGTTLTISGLSAADLNQIFTIRVTDGTNTNTTELSGLYYARMIAGSGSDTFTVKQTLGRTLYLYSTTVSGLTESVDAYVEE